MTVNRQGDFCGTAFRQFVLARDRQIPALRDGNWL